MHMVPQWGGHKRSCDKLNILYLHLQNTHRHQGNPWTTKQGADLQWDPPILKVKWPFDHVTLREVTWQFEKFIFPLLQDLWAVNQGAYLWEEVQHANA